MRGVELSRSLPGDGAIGCLIYSDPRDDGYSGGERFERRVAAERRRATRQRAGQRRVYGRSLTPGVGATPDAKRVAIKDAQTLTKIPVLPISYGDAQPLLEAMSGAIAPRDWRGGLPITYHIGPGPAKVHLKLHRIGYQAAYDVIGKFLARRFRMSG